MLVEKQNVRQIPNEGFRRWFTDNYFDLIVWYEGEEIVGFQLCYDKGNDEHALTWRPSSGFSHNRIDDGEIPYAAKMTPILVADGVFDKDEIAERFRNAARKIEYEIVDLVYRKLKEFPAKRSSQPA